MNEMGAGVWVHTTMYVVNLQRMLGREVANHVHKRPDITVITLDLGLDLHLDMPLADAKEYVKKKLEILKK